MNDPRPMVYVVLEKQPVGTWDVDDRWEPVAVYQSEEEARTAAAIDPSRYRVADTWFYAAKEAV